MKVAILGFAKSSRDLAPWDDRSWSIWGVNGTWKVARRLDRIFDLHAPWIYEWEQSRRPAGHVDYLRAFPGPVYLIEARADMPTSRAYPLDDVISALGRPYLTSSIAMMVALALIEGADEIALYGVEMATASEYADQRPGLEYLLGRAEERGVTIILPEGCSILSGPVYGRGDLNTGGERLTPDQFSRRMGMLARRQGEYERQAARLDGAIREAEYRLSVDNPTPAYRERVERLREELAETITNLNRVAGMLSEARFWAAQTPEGAAQERWRVPAPVSLPERPTGDQCSAMEGCTYLHLHSPADHGLLLVRGEAG